MIDEKAALEAELERLKNENVSLKAKQPKKKRISRKAISDQKKKLAEFIILLNQGKTREEIIELMGLHPHQFEAFFRNYYEEAEAEQTSKTPMRIFAEYVGKQNQLCRDLEGLKDALSDKWRNAQAYVAAVKTQSEILDKLIKTGQDLGLIQKTPDQVLMVGDRDAREVGADELESFVFTEMESIKGLVSKRGKKPKGKSNIIEFNTIKEQRDSQ
jgi:hypothetical protein